MATDLTAYLDVHHQEHVERVRSFVRQPSISADGTGITAMAELVAASIREVGGSADIVPTAGHPEVLGRLDAGTARTLLFYGMYDVQPVEGEEWMVPPFAGEVVDLPGHGPSVVARGATNQKGPLAGFLNVLDAYRVVAGGPPCNVIFMIEGEEELGSRHLGAFVESYREALRADAAWIGSPTWRLIQALTSMMGHDEQILIEGFYDEVSALDADEEHLLERLTEVFDERRHRGDDRPAPRAPRRCYADIEINLWQAYPWAPMYLFSRVLGIPFVMGGLGHGGRAHSPNEYAMIEGMRLFERSVAAFLQRFAEK